VARRKDEPPAQRATGGGPAGRPSKAATGAPARRTAQGAIRSAPALVVPLQVGGITIDGAQLMIERDGHASWFTPVEWRLLCVFLRSPGAVLSREELAEQAWGVTDEEGYGAVNVYISRLRRKLDPTPGSNGRMTPDLIQTVRHQGYRLVLDEADGRRVGGRSADGPVNARSARRA
jgi:DNA-binding response OmpR family regulator